MKVLINMSEHFENTTFDIKDLYNTYLWKKFVIQTPWNLSDLYNKV